MRIGADKSAVGAMNRPLRLLAYMYFIHPNFPDPVDKSASYLYHLGEAAASLTEEKKANRR